MTTPDMITWYNGETQWSYMKANDEVNVSVPTPEEQQSMNPYTFVNLYKEGYHYQLKETTLRGKSCYEITLTTRNKQKSPHTIILDINKDNHNLMCIRMQQRKKDSGHVSPSNSCIPDNRSQQQTSNSTRKITRRLKS